MQKTYQEIHGLISEVDVQVQSLLEKAEMIGLMPARNANGCRCVCSLAVSYLMETLRHISVNTPDADIEKAFEEKLRERIASSEKPRTLEEFGIAG